MKDGSNPSRFEGIVQQVGSRWRTRHSGRVMKGKWKAAGVGTVALVAVTSTAWFGWLSPEDAGFDAATFETARGPLKITVLEGGTIESLDSQEIKSQIKGWQGTKILSIKDEGYYVTEEDVENGLVLVQLDTSELEDKLTTAEIQYKGTQASLMEAKEGYEIQLNKSESEIYEVELELKFAKLELEKYLGADLTMTVLTEVESFFEEMNFTITGVEPLRGVEEEGAAASPEDLVVQDAAEPASEDVDPKIMGGNGDHPVANDAPAGGADEADEPAESVELSSTAFRSRHPKIDFRSYADPALLGEGEANQKLRELKDKLLLARKEYQQAETKLEGSERLYEKNFLTSNELENDQMDVEKKRIGIEAAETAMQLFVQYEFPKEAEKRLSDYVQAIRKLERTRKQAISELAKARAKKLSTEAQSNIEQERIREYKDQIEKATMRAEIPGLVVYGGSGVRYWDSEPIKEGATVRERQTIITIPDTSSMAVKAKIHESAIKRVAKGQKATIHVDAFPDRELAGEVTKVAVLPDSEDRWMNPDLKVYETIITIDGNHEWLKPGMSAEVEILIETLENVLYIPIQSVVPWGDKQVCYVLEGGTPQRRVVKTGELTVSFIQILEGLEEGEEVLVRPPETGRQDNAGEDDVAEGAGESESAETPPGEEGGDESESTETLSEEGGDGGAETPEEPVEVAGS